MVDLCADVIAEIGMRINSTKCAILRFGPQYANACTTVWFQDSPIDFCNKAKYLGIQLQSNKVFSFDLSYCKAKFYRAFNGLFHRAAKLRNEITTLHLVSSYCKPHLLYATECLALSVTQMRSLQHTWYVRCLMYSMYVVRMLILYVQSLISAHWILSLSIGVKNL